MSSDELLGTTNRCPPYSSSSPLLESLSSLPSSSPYLLPPRDARGLRSSPLLISCCWVRIANRSSATAALPRPSSDTQRYTHRHTYSNKLALQPCASSMGNHGPLSSDAKTQEREGGGGPLRTIRRCKHPVVVKHSEPRQAQLLPKVRQTLLGAQERLAHTTPRGAGSVVAVGVGSTEHRADRLEYRKQKPRCCCSWGAQWPSRMRARQRCTAARVMERATHHATKSTLSE